MTLKDYHIFEYIDYLKSIGFTVTLHGKIITDEAFLKYNYHQNPFCHYVKSVLGEDSQCRLKQKKIPEHCTGGSFFGCCYAGVGEFVYPLYDINSPEAQIGFISVSGYFCAQSAEKAKRFAEKINIPFEEIKPLAEKYLNSNIPEKSVVDAVINPLVFMLEAYYITVPKGSSREDRLYKSILQYIAENCHSKITVAELGREFNYSVSSISHLFAKKSGKSLPEYIDSLRLNEAKWYLLHSDLSVSEIAALLGYGSSNYFAYAFKKKTGVTPKKYKTEHN